MKLLHPESVEAELVELEKIPAYTTLLKAAEIPDDHPGHQLFQASVFYPSTIEGKAPNSFSFMADCTNMPSCYDTLDGQQICRMYQFLNNNGRFKIVPTNQDGDCLFGAFRRSTTLPAECADVHIRRLVVKASASHHDFFYLLFKRNIAMTYGLDRDPPEVLQERIRVGTISAQDLREQQLPGPFSFASYLRHMIKDSTYGDSNIIMAMSMIWNIKITCLYAESLFEIRFRHNQRITKADMVLVLSSETEHYVTAGKRLYYSRKWLQGIHKGLS